MLPLPPPASVEEVGAGVFLAGAGSAGPAFALGVSTQIAHSGGAAICCGWQCTWRYVANLAGIYHGEWLGILLQESAIKKLPGKKECNNVGPVHQDAAAPVQGEASSNPLVEVMGLGVREGRPTPKPQMAADCQAT